MTDLEISKALALAIGWTEKHIVVNALDNYIRCYRNERQWSWQKFDYRDWTVIGPIAEKYNKFPIKMTSGVWITDLGQVGTDTPQKAIALAVIGAKK